MVERECDGTRLVTLWRMSGREMEEMFWKLNQQDFVINGREILEGFKDYSKVSGMGNLDSFTELRAQKGRRFGEFKFEVALKISK